MNEKNSPADREEEFVAVADVDHKPSREIGEAVARLKGDE